ERTVIRGTHPGGTTTTVALHLQDDEKTGADGPITVSSCVLEDNLDTALLAISPRITVERSVIRRTQSGAAGVTGYGVQVDRALSGAHVAVTMRDVIVERATTD